MFGLIALAAAFAAAYVGHTRTRRFTRRRLRYTRVGEHPLSSGVVAGLGTAIVASPLVAVLPIVGAGTAMALGFGVGSGVTAGARERLE